MINRTKVEQEILKRFGVGDNMEITLKKTGETLTMRRTTKWSLERMHNEKFMVQDSDNNTLVGWTTLSNMATFLMNRNTANMNVEIKVTSICKVVEDALGKDWWKAGHEAETKAMKTYCEKNNAHYYAKPRESFFEWEAVQEAMILGKPEVVVEDMS